MGKALSCGPGGVNIDFVTAGAAQILAGYTGADIDGNPVPGNIQDIAFPESVSTGSQGPIIAHLVPTSAGARYVNIPVGYNPALKHYTLDAVQTQTKTITPSTSQQAASPDEGKFLSAVTVNAIPSQTAGGTYTLDSTTTSKSIAASKWLTSQFKVQVNVYTGG